jgi:hypothetical protein
MKVTAMVKNGKAIKNQFILTSNIGEFFQSYETVIACKTNAGEVILNEESWNASNTTSKYRCLFLGETTKETQEKIENGRYKMFSNEAMECLKDGIIKTEENGKKGKIKSIAEEMIKKSCNEMIKKVEKILNSGAIDIEKWDENYNSMILPKCIVNAILKDESDQYSAAGTSFEKEVKKEVKNIMLFL